MIILILKIAAGISLIPFVLIAISTIRIRIQLMGPRGAANPSGVPWDRVALYGGLIPASELILLFKANSIGLLSAIAIIIFGFAGPHLPGLAFKNLDLFYYISLGPGLAGGWIAAPMCARYGNQVLWNILGVKPPQGVGDGDFSED